MNGKYILKSGTDFRQFSAITMNFTEEKPTVEIEAVEVTAEYEKNPALDAQLEKYSGSDFGQRSFSRFDFSLKMQSNFDSAGTEQLP